MTGPDGQFEAVVATACDLGPQWTPEHARQGLVHVEALLEPAGARKAASAVARMRAMCARRTETESDVALMAAAYIEELSKYPADIVQELGEQWPRLSKWWPAWHELQTRLDRKVRQRQVIRDAFADRAMRGAG